MNLHEILKEIQNKKEKIKISRENKKKQILCRKIRNISEQPRANQNLKKKK